MKPMWKWAATVAAVLVLLAAAFWYGGDAPGLQGPVPAPSSAAPVSPSAAPSPDPETPAPDPAPVPSPTVPPAPSTPSAAEPAPADEPSPVVPPAAGETQSPPTAPTEDGGDPGSTCTLSISCAAILDHLDWLDPDKTELVPEDGSILPPTQVSFSAGESVFQVLQRACTEHRIHLETASNYIEGIHNLYEFDCGELSGWMYSVNGWFPNYGCASYALQDGDVIRWEYSCDQGADLGAGTAAGG